MRQFVNPFTDIGFKRIFGQDLSKPLLMDFLNNLLLGERRITDLRFLDKEQPGVYDGDRSLIYDIYCETDTGEHIIVEMQNREQSFFKNRSIYYVAESIARQGERGTVWRYDIKSVYFVSFLNFRLDDIGHKFRTDATLMDMDTKEVFSDRIRLIYLQLPYFVLEAAECTSDFDRWIYVLKNMETLNRLPWAAQNSVFKRLSEIADVSSMTKEERIKYDEGLRKYRDTINVLTSAVEKGRAEGMAKGLAQGLLNTARQLKQMGMDAAFIHEATGLPVDEINDL